MKNTLILVPAAVCLALTLPVHGSTSASRMATEPDTTLADTVAWSDSIDEEFSYSEDSDWAGDGDSEAVDSTADDSQNDFCTPNDELLSEYSSKSADYSLQNSKDANAGITFSATLFTPDQNGKGEVKKGSGYALMASRVLSASLDPAAYAKWKDDNLDKMLENKWKAVKQQYTASQTEAEQKLGVAYEPQNSSYRTSVTPVWALKDKGVTTYCVEDEVYEAGDTIGNLYHYYLSFSEKGDSLLGLTDIFKESALPDVFRLVGEKLSAATGATSAAELVPAPASDSYFVRSGYAVQYAGKWYPRPALTECGVVFVYPRCTPDGQCAGVENILLDAVETQGWLK